MSRRVVIIGGGVIGLCCAYYAARKGHAVTVLDREPESHEGCSYGNAGMIVPSHFVPLAAPGMVALGLKWMWNPESPFYVRPRIDRELWNWGFKFWRAANPRHVKACSPVLRDLHLASRACFEELASLAGNEFGLVREGLLMLCQEAHTLEEEARAAETAGLLGLESEVLDPKQTAAKEPQLRMEVAGAVYYPKDCHLTPNRFMAGLKQQLKALKASLHFGASASGWRLEGRRIAAVRSHDKEFEADEFVICGGAWSPQLVSELQLTLPMQAGKGYSLTLHQPKQMPRLCAILTEARVAVTPMGNTLRFGGTMEIAGLNEEINPARVRGLIKSVPRYYPEFTARDFEGVKPWCGLRPCSPDGMPYVGRTRRYDNLSIATGHAMMGLSLGPITGKLIAELLSGERPSLALGLLDPDRYAGR